MHGRISMGNNRPCSEFSIPIEKKHIHRMPLVIDRLAQLIGQPWILESRVKLCDKYCNF
jgi:hypothetical protein